MTVDDIFTALRRMTVHVFAVVGNPRGDLGHADLGRGATGLLLETPEGHFLVSAGHVVSFMNTKATGGGGVLLHAGGGECVNITPAGPGHVEPAVDLGSWPVKQAAVLRRRGKAFARHSYFGKRPTEGETVYLLGTPEALTVADAGDIRTLTTILVTAEVCSTGGDKKFLIKPKAFQSIQLHGGGRIDRPETLSGMSGSPVVAVRDGELEVVGIVKEESREPAWPLTVAHVDFVEADGSVRQPWS